MYIDENILGLFLINFNILYLKFRIKYIFGLTMLKYVNI